MDTVTKMGHIGLDSVIDHVSSQVSDNVCALISYGGNVMSDIFFMTSLEAGLRIVLYVSKNLLKDKDLKGSDETDEGTKKRNNVSQTIGPWQKRVRSQERHFLELTSKLDVDMNSLKKKKKSILCKATVRLENLTKDYEGKVKMIAGVKTRLVHLSSEVENLIQRIKEGRKLLEIRRQQNRLEIQRFDDLNRIIGYHLNSLMNQEISDGYLDDAYDEYCYEP